jgi:aspartyl-tRNA(Asn)/glutamyl-tRNA(Gln) amidotransferase subunit A
VSRLTIRQTADLVRSGKKSLRDITADHLAVIEAQNPSINAVTSVYREQALKAADAVQEKMERKEAGPLAGALLGVKEAIVERNKTATSGSRILFGYESPFTATAVSRLELSDAIPLARMNMDEFAMGSSNENSAHGVVRNPVNTAKVPGGSSGGSAAGVVAGMVNCALGSDTGGSIRQPAALTGCVGLKPTYGRVSRYGLIAYASSFDCIGPITNSVEDAAALLQVMAGRDGNDATTSENPVGDLVSATKKPAAGLRVGVPAEYFGEGLDPEIRARVMETVKKLEAQGATAVPVSLPHSRYAIATYYILATAEASSNLARFDGVRYGHRADAKKVAAELAEERKAIEERFKHSAATDRAGYEAALRKIDSALIRLYKNSRTEGFGAEVKRRIVLGTYVLSSGYYDAYYGKAQRVRRLIQQDFKKTFEVCDVIVSPTSPGTAFDLGAKMEDPVQMYLNDIYTISANLAGICGISVPVGLHSDGLPIGIQFMADVFREDLLVQAGAAVERLFATPQ